MRDARDSDRPGRVIEPLSAGEIDLLAHRAFHGLETAILAVSGGPDSMTLLVLGQAWRKLGHATRLLVATVDHGLRRESAREAAWVAAEAAKAGFEHRLLRWEGTKASTGVQEAAREARYALLASLALAEYPQRTAGIVLAHHLDDQAETFLMRLARGSGLDGLAAMQEFGTLSGHDAIMMRRPLLEVPKERLVATLQARGMAWVEDPSNRNEAFERVRVRKALGEMKALGIGAAEIGLSAARLARARRALEISTSQMMRDHVAIHGGAYGEISARAYDEAPDELQLRLVQRLIAMFGSPRERPRMVRSEALAQLLASDCQTAATLAGCRLSRNGGVIQAIREPGRRGLPRIDVAPGNTALWDGRFEVSADRSRARAVEVRALTAAELASLRRVSAGDGRPLPLAMPRAAALTLPSFWEGDRLLGVCHPALGAAFSGALEGVAASFVRG